MKIEGSSQHGHSASVARSREKNKSASPRTAFVLSALVVAGGAGATAWLKFRESKPQRTENRAEATNIVSTATTNQENAPEFFAWVSNRTDAAELLNAGTALLQEGRTSQAVLCYRRALELKPEDEEGHFNLGVAYGRLGQLDLAERHYREAIKLFPDYPEAHNNLGNVLTRQKHYGEAIEEFKVTLKLSPEDASAHNNLGRALAEQGNAMEALTHFSEAARLDTNYVEAQFNLASAYMTVGLTNEAVKQLNAVLRLRPDFPPAMQLLSRLRNNPR
jgi:tetratricopeptide (TPR) repeat protein